MRSRFLCQRSAGSTDDLCRHGAVDGWHREATRWGLGPHAQVGGGRAEMLTVDLDREGYIFDCDLSNFEDLNLNEHSKEKLVSS